MGETSEIERAARAELEAAVSKWLKVKATIDDDDVEPEDRELLNTNDPVMLGWVLVTCYTSHELELAEATATAYECADGQAAPMSRGLSMAGVDRWAQG
jgi:hypothetical protein